MLSWLFGITTNEEWEKLNVKINNAATYMIDLFPNDTRHSRQSGVVKKTLFWRIVELPAAPTDHLYCGMLFYLEDSPEGGVEGMDLIGIPLSGGRPRCSRINQGASYPTQTMPDIPCQCVCFTNLSFLLSGTSLFIVVSHDRDDLTKEGECHGKHLKAYLLFDSFPTLR